MNNTEKTKPDLKRMMLRNRINEMKQRRISQSAVRGNMQQTVPEDVVKAYLELKKNSKMPVIDPKQIIAKPEEHREKLRDLVKSFGDVVNPYTTYYKLLYTHVDNLHQTKLLQELASH